MSIKRISEMFGMAASHERLFPATDLYNEGWMLRLVLDWFSRNRKIEFDLRFFSDAKWYSEALLPSAFLPRKRGDKLAESWTHADGVIGHFFIGDNGVGDLTLSEDSKQFMVTEAKMFSKLSTGVTNARFYNQAARNVACIAEVADRAGISADSFENVGFFVIAPKSQLDKGIFTSQMKRKNIKCIVKQRIDKYQDPVKQLWFENQFLPILEKISLRSISWEEIISVIDDADSNAGTSLNHFYEKCLEFNRF